jgi:putative hydrolase
MTAVMKTRGFPSTQKTILKVLENPEVSIIGHPDDARFPIDYDEIAAAAAEHKKALELNDASLNPTTARRGAHETMPIMLASCRKYRTKILMGTDSHICWEVGDFRRSMKLLSDLNFPEDLIINFDLNKLSYVLKKH